MVEILKATDKEVASLALANLKLSPKLQVERGRRHQGASPFYKKTRPGLANGMGAAGRLGSFEGWQTAVLNLHKRTRPGLL